MFRIGKNTFYDQKNIIPMKIPEFKRSGIGLIAEFRGIPNGFPNQVVEYSASKKVCLQLDIVKYNLGEQAPMYDLMIGKLTLHNLGVAFDLKEETIQIGKILLPMRNIANLQFKSSITRALGHKTCLAQEPISTRSATKCKYEKADL